MYSQQKASQLINQYGPFSLYQIGLAELSEFSSYVFQQYAYHYHKKYQWSAPVSELVEMKHEDQKHFNHAHLFGLRTEIGDLVGTMKITRKVNGLQFPIESDFSVDLGELTKEKAMNINDVWHLGRFAIDTLKVRQAIKGLPSKEILRLLLMNAFMKMDESGNDLLVAESDILIYEIFHDLGINMQIVGKAQDYVGSPTYPVIITGQDIKSWLRLNSQDSLGLEMVLN